MKFTQFFLFTVTASVLTAAAQPNNPPPASTDTFIPETLEVPAFVPPAPAISEPLPDIQIDASVVLATEAGKILTLQRGEASTLPDLPEPPPPGPVQPVLPPSLEALARAAYQRKHSFNLGATVYNHQVGKIQWNNPETGFVYQAVCGFDIGLLAGISKLTHKGENYSFSLIHSDVNTLSGAKSPNIPEIAPGQFRITQGEPNNQDASDRLAMVRDLIAAEKERLVIYQADRLEEQRKAAAWSKAHPPVPQDETIILRPHRGSRYLADPQPETKGETTR